MFLELLWAAPELLSRSERKTKPGDVYSFGVILAEILTREDPYAELQMDPRGFANFNYNSALHHSLFCCSIYYSKDLLISSQILSLLQVFLYKNQVYKKNDAQIRLKLKNI